jgi:2-dehydropantoate 2-reductase
VDETHRQLHAQAPIGILGLYEWRRLNSASLRVLHQAGRKPLQWKDLGYTIEAIYGLSPEQFMGSTDEVLEKNLRTLVTHIGRKARNSVLQDHLKGRYSEVDFLNGLVVKKGREANVPTPLNEAVTQLTRQIQTGALKPDRSNLPLLEKMMRLGDSTSLFSLDKDLPFRTRMSIPRTNEHIPPLRT